MLSASYDVTHQISHIFLALHIILAVFLGAFIILLIYINHGKSRIASFVKNIPGPKPKPLIGNIMDMGKGNKDFFHSFVKFWKSYGSIFRIWFGSELFVMISDPKYIEVILNSNTQLDKAMLYKFIMPWLGKGLLTSTGVKWRKHRKIITPTFHFKILEEFIDVFNSTGNVLVKKLENKTNGPEFDIYPYITMCTLDAITETAMGVKINAQSNGEPEYVDALRGMGTVLVERTVNPWLASDFILQFSKTGHLQRNYLKVLHGMTKKVLKMKKEALINNGSVQEQEKEDGVKRRLAFLDMLLESSHQGNGLTDEEIREEVDTFIFEGHDTTSSGISFTLFNLAIHNDVQERAVQELKDIFGDSNRDSTFEDLQNMKYLECAIKESMRLFTTVPMYGRKLNEDLDIGDGYILPKGASVLVYDFMMHRDPKYFPCPEKYDPNRFLPDNKRVMNPFQYLPFSAGPRNCIGQKYALLEMKSIISKILRNFKLLPGKDSVKDVEENLALEMVLVSKIGINVKLEPRIHM